MSVQETQLFNQPSDAFSMNQTTPLVKRKTSRCHNVPFFLLSVLSIGLTIALFVWGSFNGYLRWFSLPVSSSQGLFCGSSRKYGYSYSPQLFTFQNFTDTIEWCVTTCPSKLHNCICIGHDSFAENDENTCLSGQGCFWIAGQHFVNIKSYCTPITKEIVNPPPSHPYRVVFAYLMDEWSTILISTLSTICIGYILFFLNRTICKFTDTVLFFITLGLMLSVGLFLLGCGIICLINTFIRSDSSSFRDLGPTVWTMIILGVFFPLKAVALFYQWKKPNPSSVKINSLHRLLKIVYSRSLGMLFSVLVFSLLYVFVVCGTCLLGLQMLSHFFIHKNRAQSTIHADVFFFLSLFSMLFGSLVFLNFIRELNNAALSLFFRLRLEELRCGDVLIDFDEKLPFLARPFVLEEKQKSFSFVHSLVYQISHNLCSIVSHSFTASLHTVLKIIVSPLFFVLQLVSSFSSASYSFRKEPIHTSLASPSLLVSAMFSLDSTTSKHHGYRVMRRNRHIFRAMDKTKRLTMRTERYFPVLICLIANLAVWFKFLPPFHSLLADPHSPEKIIAKWIAVGSSCVVGLIGMGAVVTPFSILLDVFVIRTRINKHFPPPSPSLSYSSTSSQKDHPGFSREGTWVDNILNDIDVSERDAKERQVRKWEGWDS